MIIAILYLFYLAIMVFTLLYTAIKLDKTSSIASMTFFVFLWMFFASIFSAIPFIIGKHFSWSISTVFMIAIVIADIIYFIKYLRGVESDNINNI